VKLYFKYAYVSFFFNFSFYLSFGDILNKQYSKGNEIEKDSNIDSSENSIEYAGALMEAGSVLPEINVVTLLFTFWFHFFEYFFELISHQ